jgi:hypothetical protein
MTPEEKNAILQFMGMTYGHSHKLDKEIVGESQFVKPISTTVRKVFEEVLKSGTTSTPIDYQPIEPVNYSDNIVYSESVPLDNPVEVNNISNSIIPKSIPIADSDISKQLEAIVQQLSRISEVLESVTKQNNVRERKKIKDKI